MNLKLDIEILGWLLVGEGALEILPGLLGLALREPVGPFLWSALIAATFGLSVALANRGEDRRMRLRDGFLVVTGAWILLCAFGALPYLLSGELGIVDSLFESTSGFTTTGASVLASVETAPRSLLLWRSMTQWIGGMGIIVFAIALLPLLGVGGMALFQAEVPGPIAEKLTPRVRETARRLWAIYVGLTVAAAAGFWAAGMGPFDAVCHALTTISTGGFSTRELSLGAYHSAPIEWVAIAFMLLGGVNFVLIWLALTGRVKRVLRDAELRLYVGAVIVLSLITFWTLRSAGAPAAVGDSLLRDAVFQVLSLATTTGFGTADYDLWPPAFHTIALPLLLVGAMAGSTGGGIKSLHVLLAWRKMRATFATTLHRHAVQTVRYRGTPVSEATLMSVFAFLAVYMGLATITAGVVASAGADLVSSISASLTSVGNVGPGLATFGPTDSFGWLPGYAKLTLSAAMLAGRLEIFTVLVVFTPGFWRR